MVDAEHAIQHRGDEQPEGFGHEAVEQIAFTDRCLPNECDLVDGLP